MGDSSGAQAASDHGRGLAVVRRTLRALVSRSALPGADEVAVALGALVVRCGADATLPSGGVALGDAMCDLLWDAVAHGAAPETSTDSHIMAVVDLAAALRESSAADAAAGLGRARRERLQPLYDACMDLLGPERLAERLVDALSQPWNNTPTLLTFGAHAAFAGGPVTAALRLECRRAAAPAWGLTGAHCARALVGVVGLGRFAFPADAPRRGTTSGSSPQGRSGAGSLGPGAALDPLQSEYAQWLVADVFFGPSPASPPTPEAAGNFGKSLCRVLTAGLPTDEADVVRLHLRVAKELVHRASAHGDPAVGTSLVEALAPFTTLAMGLLAQAGPAAPGRRTSPRGEGTGTARAAEDVRVLVDTYGDGSAEEGRRRVVTMMRNLGLFHRAYFWERLMPALADALVTRADAPAPDGEDDQKEAIELAVAAESALHPMLNLLVKEHVAHGPRTAVLWREAVDRRRRAQLHAPPGRWDAAGDTLPGDAADWTRRLRMAAQSGDWALLRASVRALVQEGSLSGLARATLVADALLAALATVAVRTAPARSVGTRARDAFDATVGQALAHAEAAPFMVCRLRSLCIRDGPLGTLTGSHADTLGVALALAAADRVPRPDDGGDEHWGLPSGAARGAVFDMLGAVASAVVPSQGPAVEVAWAVRLFAAYLRACCMCSHGVLSADDVRLAAHQGLEPYQHEPALDEAQRPQPLAAEASSKRQRTVLAELTHQPAALVPASVAPMRGASPLGAKKATLPPAAATVHCVVQPGLVRALRALVDRLETILSDVDGHCSGNPHAAAVVDALEAAGGVLSCGAVRSLEAHLSRRLEARADRVMSEMVASVWKALGTPPPGLAPPPDGSHGCLWLCARSMPAGQCGDQGLRALAAALHGALGPGWQAEAGPLAAGDPGPYVPGSHGPRVRHQSVQLKARDGQSHRLRATFAFEEDRACSLAADLALKACVLCWAGCEAVAPPAP